MNNDIPGDNAPHVFDRYPPDTAHWLAGICDEASAKAGDSPYEFRKIMCELIVMNLRDGITHAFRVAQQIIVANAPAAKHIEQQYLKYDQARSAVIETGPDTADGPTSTTKGCPTFQDVGLIRSLVRSEGPGASGMAVKAEPLDGLRDLAARSSATTRPPIGRRDSIAAVGQRRRGRLRDRCTTSWRRWPCPRSGPV
ncbi:hypothetical protein [Streptomyces sp. AC550_RSS872]|uniref:hypothetical protein n=1 Tax=Streptomyces sp. AC550_RSS872 TaxID=2823689 RepID=UPI001C25BFD0|nr:hypothetical protein [Streptomyces sp. AC550_RSS872]